MYIVATTNTLCVIPGFEEGILYVNLIPILKGMKVHNIKNNHELIVAKHVFLAAISSLCICF